ncbi:MAG: hypothetical protein HYY37_02670 [Candidatus Aenigmarchaeota archaeon]|nr:hypothetical protein [Candidatus Aenigmarchaeota archaeon]
MGRTDSVESWKAWWFARGRESWQDLGIDGNYYGADDWIQGREIRISRMPGIDEEAVPYVTKGIRDKIGEIGLDCTVVYRGVDPAVAGYVAQATEGHRVDPRKLVQILAAEKERKPRLGGKAHADVVLLDRFLATGDHGGIQVSIWAGCCFHQQSCRVRRRRDIW